MPKLVLIRNPFAPQIGLKIFEVCPGLTVSDGLAAAGWRLPPATVLVRDGKLIKRSDIDLVPIANDEIVSFVVLPRGGKGTSQIVGAIAMIALAVVAWAYAPALAGAAADTTAFGSVTYGQLATVAVMVSGSMIISTLMPTVGGTSSKSAESAYNLSPQSNMAQLRQPEPENFGRLRRYPSQAAQPYVRYIDNKQYVFETLLVGRGQYSFEEHRIGDNSLWKDGSYTGTYPEIEFEIVPPGSSITLFSDDNVVTCDDVSGIELLGSNEDDYDWSGPFVVNPAGTQTTSIEVDIVLPGLYKVSSSGGYKTESVSWQIQARTIDKYGVATGDWTDILTGTRSASTPNPIRFTLSAAVTSGRYQVRARRSDEKNTSASANNTLYWSGLRAVLPSILTYDDVTVIAVKAKATKNLQGSGADKYNVICTRMLPVYNPTTKTWGDPVATRDIAPAAAYILHNENGGNVAYNQIALDQLWSLQTTWTSRGDKFDGDYTSRQSLWNSLIDCLNVGRSIPLIIGPKVTFRRDEAQSVYRMAFTPQNMQSSSFGIDYVMDSSDYPNALLGIYTDENTWNDSATVLAKMDDSDATEQTATQVNFFGCVQRAQVWRELRHRVFVNRYRRRFPNFKTEYDGTLAVRGDKVLVSHWLPTGWGKTARVVDLTQDSAGDLLTLSEPWQPPAGQESLSRLITVMTPDGRAYGPVTFDVVDTGADTLQAIVRLTSSFTLTVGKYANIAPRNWGIWSGSGLQLARPQAIFGTASSQPMNCLVVTMKPDGRGKCTVTTVIDDDRVYNADIGTVPDDDFATNASAELTITGLTVTQETLSSGSIRTTVTVAGATDATSFTYMVGLSTGSYADPVSGNSRIFSFDHAAGILKLNVRAVNSAGSGSWFEYIYQAGGTAITTVPDNVASGTAVPETWYLGASVSYTWTAADRALWYRLDIYASVLEDGSTTNTWIKSATVYNTSFTYAASTQSLDFINAGIGDDSTIQRIFVQVTAVNNIGESAAWLEIPHIA